MEMNFDQDKVKYLGGSSENWKYENPSMEDKFGEYFKKAMEIYLLNHPKISDKAIKFVKNLENDDQFRRQAIRGMKIATGTTEDMQKGIVIRIDEMLKNFKE